MDDKMRDPCSLKLLGGRLCLDFVNTVEWRGKEGPGEYLKSYHDLIAWCRHVGTITSKEAKILSQKADEHRSEAEKVRSNAVKLREAIYRIFSAIIEGKKPAGEILAVFNKHLAKTMRFAQIIESRGGFRWNTNGDTSKLDWVLNPIIYSTADLLVSDELTRVKSCFNPFCGWLFLDISRNRSRRWCDMKDCGNRAKASRFYQKKQTAKRDSVIR